MWNCMCIPGDPQAVVPPWLHSVFLFVRSLEQARTFSEELPLFAFSQSGVVCFCVSVRRGREVTVFKQTWFLVENLNFDGQWVEFSKYWCCFCTYEMGCTVWNSWSLQLKDWQSPSKHKHISNLLARNNGICYQEERRYIYTMQSWQLTLDLENWETTREITRVRVSCDIKINCTDRVPGKQFYGWN